VFDAPCGDMPGVFDVPDGFIGDALELWARPVLAICQPCPFKSQCVEHVDPRGSHNNIVAGGVVWQKGRPVAFLGRERERDSRGAKPTKPCGTVAAYKRHQYWGEDICEPCRVAFRVDANRRNQERRDREAAS
jgi:hypothetical protein